MAKGMGGGKRRTGWRRGALALTVLGAALPAWAQQPPDAGALQQQIENTLPQPLPAQPAPVLPAPSAAPAAPAGVTVTVSGFAFVGNTRLPEQKLQAAVASYVGRPLSLGELQGVAAVVAEAYRSGGWIVRVFLPQQELADGGVVTIQIVEARFGDVRLQMERPGETLRVNEERLRRTVLAAQPKGGPVSGRSVDRALLLVDDLAGVGAGGALAAGQVEGETDLVLRVANEPRLAGDVRVDNTGSRSTGANRLSANLAVASPSGAGDSVTVNLLHTAGSDYGRLGYRRPVGYAGWTAGINASAMNYELVGADFVSFQSEGSATTVGLEASYPLLRGRQANLSLQLAPEHKHYDNRAAGVTTTRYDINVLGLTLAGNHSDSVGGGGNVSGNVALSWGEVDLSGSPNAAADAITTGAGGGFAKLHYALNRQQTLGAAMNLRAGLSGQFAAQNLDSAEKFYIGGPAGVRAYSASDGSGAEGVMVNLELSGKLPWRLTPSCFYDWGQVKVNRDNDFPGAPNPNRYQLQGAGLALAWAHPRGANARITWAHRIGDNPNPDLKGNDQDGTLTLDRFWLEAGYAF